MSLRRFELHFPIALRRSALLPCLVAALAAPLPARAQPPLKVSIAGGYTMPLAPDLFSDTWLGGFALAAGLHYRVSTRANVWLEVGYHRFGFDTEAFEASIASDFPSVSVSGNDLWIMPIHIGTDVTLTSWGNTRPYLLAGLGYDHLDHVAGAASGPNAAAVLFPDLGGDAFGTRLGAGVRTLLTPSMTLFFDAAWHQSWVSPDPVAFLPIRIGLRF